MQREKDYGAIAKAANLNIKEIGRRCGVSDSTVNNVLQTKPMASKATIEKIHRTVEEEAQKVFANLERLMGSPNAG